MKVRARISDGLARRVAMSQAIRRVMTWVLPVPGAGDDEQRPVAVRDRAQLVRVEPAEQRLEPRRDALVTAGSMTGTSSRQAGSWSSGDRLAAAADASASRSRSIGSGRAVGRGGHVGSIAGRRDS